MSAYAHSANAEGVRQALADHLRGTAALAARFAEALGAPETGRVLGLWHDLGKFHPDFQSYLAQTELPNGPRRGPDHKMAGALVAQMHGADLLALAIQGHHGGLRDPSTYRDWIADVRSKERAQEAIRLAEGAIPELHSVAEAVLPPTLHGDARRSEFFLRLLYSALVDADSRDTERHFDARRSEARQINGDLTGLWSLFAQAQAALMSAAPDTEVNRARRQVYEACLTAASGPTGVYRLRVPTGGGKTRSGMAFALRHALTHGQQRVIVALPFISITEQTADDYRRIFPDPEDALVLEHHSGLLNEDDDERLDARSVWRRLAAEDWDAPIVVTTTVQLFESLFSNRRTAMRKLHRLARSVLIIDEAQALPLHLLRPILSALEELWTHYGTTVVLSTATQPAFEAVPGFSGLDAREIVPDHERLFDRLVRVEYEYRIEEPVSWQQVAEIVGAEEQCLVIVNTRRHAHQLLDALADTSALHLSTLLCGAHRRRVIDEIKRRLAHGQACRVVATQVVEAGVDLDFPMVLRALAPLDSIIQAAGRCNREGRLERGHVLVFRPQDGGLPHGWYRTATQMTEARLRGDPQDPELVAEYYRQLYRLVGLDREGIESLRYQLQFPKVAERFKMIDEDTVSIVVPYEGERVREIVSSLRSTRGSPRSLMRQAQPYVVGLPKWQAEQSAAAARISWISPGLGEWVGEYDDVRGVSVFDLQAGPLVF